MSSRAELLVEEELLKRRNLLIETDFGGIRSVTIRTLLAAPGAGRRYVVYYIHFDWENTDVTSERAFVFDDVTDEPILSMYLPGDTLNRSQRTLGMAPLKISENAAIRYTSTATGFTTAYLTVIYRIEDV